MAPDTYSRRHGGVFLRIYKVYGPCIYQWKGQTSLLSCIIHTHLPCRTIKILLYHNVFTLKANDGARALRVLARKITNMFRSSNALQESLNKKRTAWSCFCCKTLKLFYMSERCNNNANKIVRNGTGEEPKRGEKQLFFCHRAYVSRLLFANQRTIDVLRFIS